MVRLLVYSVILSRGVDTSRVGKYHIIPRCWTQVPRYIRTVIYINKRFICIWAHVYSGYIACVVTKIDYQRKCHKSLVSCDVRGAAISNRRPLLACATIMGNNVI